MRAWRMFPWSNQRTQRGQAELALELQARREALAREQQQNANYRAELRAQAAPKPIVTPSAGAPYFPQQTPIPIDTDGHFHPVIRINGVQLTMLADTGASSVALTAKDAQKIGFNLQTLQFTGKSDTANGTVPSASLLLPEVNIGGIILRNVRASCCVIGSESLLGMSVLGQLNIRTVNGLMYLAPK